MTKKSTVRHDRSGKSALAKAVEALIDRVGSVLDTLAARPQPALVPVRVDNRRRRAE